MGSATIVTTSSSGNRYVDGLLWRDHFDAPGRVGTPLALEVLAPGERFAFGFEDAVALTTDAEAAAFRRAAELMAEVCGVRFRDAASQADADVLAAGVDQTAVGQRNLGLATLPVRGGPGTAVIVNGEAYEAEDGAGLVQGGYDFVTFLHELGHAVGLKHPHDDDVARFPAFPGVTEAFRDYGRAQLNQGVFTVMSYNDGYPTRDGSNFASGGSAGTFMAFDVAALQHLYGPNASHRTGDDVYVLPGRGTPATFYACLWDAGGEDRIVAGTNRDCVIDLNAATLRAGPGGGGALSAHVGVRGGYTIANGVTIEDAAGGRGDDTLIGNRAGNRLDGAAGDDALRGGGGADRLAGGAGADLFVFAKLAESRGRRVDRIADFDAAADRIDLARIDDGAGWRLRFVEDGAFAGPAGGVRVAHQPGADRTWILLDADADAGAEMRIRLDGIHVLGADDFVL